MSCGAHRGRRPGVDPDRAGGPDSPPDGLRMDVAVELQRRRLAHVERWRTTAEYEAQLRSRSADATDDS